MSSFETLFAPSRWLLPLECKRRMESMFRLYCVMSTAELLILTPAVNYFLAVPKMWGCLYSVFVWNLLARNTGESLKYPVNCSACVDLKFREMLQRKWGKHFSNNFLLLPHEDNAWRRVPWRASRLVNFWNEQGENELYGVFHVNVVWVWNAEHCFFFRGVIYALYSLLFKWKRNQSEKCMRAHSPIAANVMV